MGRLHGRRACLALAACAIARGARGAGPLRGQRGDWTLMVPSDWEGSTYAALQGPLKEAQANGPAPLARVLTAVSTVARTADAVLFSFDIGTRTGLPLIAINSTAPGTRPELPGAGDVEFWTGIAETYVEQAAGRSLRVRPPWSGARRQGEPMAAAIWDFTLQGLGQRTEEMILIARARRLTSLRLFGADAATHRFARVQLWRAANEIHFDETGR